MFAGFAGGIARFNRSFLIASLLAAVAATPAVAHEFKDQELILVPSVFLGMILSVQGQVSEGVRDFALRWDVPFVVRSTRAFVAYRRGKAEIVEGDVGTAT